MPIASHVALLMVAILASCGPDPAHMAWYRDYLEVERQYHEGQARLKQLDALEARAPGPGDRCIARMAAATTAVALARDDAETRCRLVLADPHCAGQHPEAHYRLFARSLSGDRPPKLPSELLQAHPHSYWARQTFEDLWQASNRVGTDPLATHYLGWYEQLKETPLAGHCLYYGARAQMGTDPEAALSTLRRLIAGHSESPRWDEAVIEAADLLHSRGQTPEEEALLLAAIETRSDRGGQGDAYTARLRLRLGERMEAAGRFDDALAQYATIVNGHDLTSIKDDALWRSADIYASLGQQDRERRALKFLVDHCPWSRHKEAASARLGQF